jgi:hypothetical protein
LASIGLNIAYFTFIVPRFSREYIYSDSGFASISFSTCIVPIVLQVICIIWGCAAAASYNNRSQATIVR